MFVRNRQLAPKVARVSVPAASSAEWVRSAVFVRQEREPA
jgi:hypothetical protein